MKKITGIILCGGKSCRFGTDKGLCTLAGKLMISYPLEAMKNLCDEIIISSNDSRYERLGYKVVPDEVKDTGPIGGIYSALKHSATTDNLIVSCDMPFVTERLLRYIFDNKNGALVAAAYSGNYIEPLCSYFHKESLAVIEQMIQAGEYKLTRLQDKLDFKKITIDENLDFYTGYLFLNVNTRKDYEKANVIIEEFKRKKA